MVLCDIEGKAADTPVYQLFSGKSPRRVSLYAYAGDSAIGAEDSWNTQKHFQVVEELFSEARRRLGANHHLRTTLTAGWYR